MVTRIQLRRDTAANWTATNPILDQGEPGYETDTGNIKYGDGATRWSNLSYYAGGAAGLSYNLPAATSGNLGGVKIAQNTGLQISGTGVASLTTATTSTIGGVVYGPVLGVYQTNTQTVAVNGPLNSFSSFTPVIYDKAGVTSDPAVLSYNKSTGVTTIGRSGYYQVNASVSIDNTAPASANSATTIGAGIAVNSTIIDFNAVPGSFGLTTPFVSTLIQANSGDQVQVVAYVGWKDAPYPNTKFIATTTGTGITNAFYSLMSMIYIRPLS
jgi:hypothetical protein